MVQCFTCDVPKKTEVVWLSLEHLEQVFEVFEELHLCWRVFGLHLGNITFQAIIV